MLQFQRLLFNVNIKVTGTKKLLYILYFLTQRSILHFQLLCYQV